MMRIRISWKGGEVYGELRETGTVRILAGALPFSAPAHRWGEEVYFDTPITSELEPDASDVVEPGTICFWVDGDALALPFGPTPVSRGDECRLVSKANIMGHIEGDSAALRAVRSGDMMTVEEA